MGKPSGTDFPKDLFRTAVGKPFPTDFPKDLFRTAVGKPFRKPFGIDFPKNLFWDLVGKTSGIDFPKDWFRTNDNVLIALFWRRPRPYNDSFWPVFLEFFLKCFARRGRN